MRQTGVYATAEERDRVADAVRRAHRTPVIALSSRHALEQGGLSGQAWEHARQLCHDLALQHGLPEIQGWYGMAEDGEFIVAEEGDDT